MTFFEDIKIGLDEAVDFEKGNINANEVMLTSNTKNENEKANDDAR